MQVTYHVQVLHPE